MNGKGARGRKSGIENGKAYHENEIVVAGCVAVFLDMERLSVFS